MLSFFPLWIFGMSLSLDFVNITLQVQRVVVTDPVFKPCFRFFHFEYLEWVWLLISLISHYRYSNTSTSGRDRSSSTASTGSTTILPLIRTPSASLTPRQLSYHHLSVDFCLRYIAITPSVVVSFVFILHRSHAVSCSFMIKLFLALPSCSFVSRLDFRLKFASFR